MAGAGSGVRRGLLVTAVVLAVAAPARAQAPDRQGAVAAGAPFTWTGEAASAISGNTTLTPYPSDPGACSLPHEHCDRTLLRVDGDPDRLQVDVAIAAGDLPSPFGHDLDLYVYASDAAGALGERVGESENGDSDPERVVLKRPRGWYLVHVVWAWALDSGFAAAAVAHPPEALAAASPAPVPPATTPSLPRLEIVSASLPALTRGGLRARLVCPGPCAAVASLVAQRAGARRLHLRQPRIAVARGALPVAGAKELRLRPAASARRRLRRVRRLPVTVRVIVRDAAGLEHTLIARVVLRRG